MNGDKINLAIFASGSGTNAENLAIHFQDHEKIQVTEILTNKPNAFVIERARKLGINSSVFSKEELNHESFLDRLENIDYIILAGFLLLIPGYLTEAFPNKILNIHPALLPNYGGKGMYGMRVHQAVIDAGESRSGITIHLVNEKYDDGRVLFQGECDVDPSDSAEALAAKIHQLEYEHFPRIVEDYVLS